jgi:hypothetical protein
MVVLIYLFHRGLLWLLPENLLISLSTGLILLVLFTRFVLRIEKKELMQFGFSKWLYKG